MSNHDITADIELAHRFNYHPPRDEATKELHEQVRHDVFVLAAFMDDNLPVDRPREKAIVQTKLEEAMMWANAAIARSKLGVADG
jgi:hypothetical protein